MVRLKAKSGLFVFKLHSISIPYGSIKSKKDTQNYSVERLFQFLMVRLKAVLILFIYLVSLFQFLMVRLKVVSPVMPISERLVSIPYGSIKSPHKEFVKFEYNVSIPYGSIKSSVSEVHDVVIPDFNSLWFD